MLDEIGKKHGTDKSSNIHDYLKKYEKYLPYRRDEKLKILEIGVENGASLKTWKEYFYNSEIIGVDINSECVKHNEERILIEIGSQVDSTFLENVGNKHGQFDMILDDGSHINEHIISSFKDLFKYVKSGGLYIVEDVCTSYWHNWGGSKYGKDTVVSYFKNIVDEVNFWGEELEVNNGMWHARKDQPLIEQLHKKGHHFVGTEIESINFLNSIIIMTKR